MSYFRTQVATRSTHGLQIASIVMFHGTHENIRSGLGWLALLQSRRSCILLRSSHAAHNRERDGGEDTPCRDVHQNHIRENAPRQLHKAHPMDRHEVVSRWADYRNHAHKNRLAADAESSTDPPTN